MKGLFETKFKTYLWHCVPSEDNFGLKAFENSIPGDLLFVFGEPQQSNPDYVIVVRCITKFGVAFINVNHITRIEQNENLK